MLKFGVIGTNFISDRFAEAAATVEGAEVSAVYSRGTETGRAFADKHGIKNVFDSLDGMLSSDIDAVYVASPTFLHKEHSVKAMQSGKHVLCEKMLAVTLSDAVLMNRAATECGVVLVEAMRPYFDPALTAIKDAIAEIGAVRRASFEFSQYSSRYDRFKCGEMTNAFNPAIGNSAISDIGIYPINMCVSLFGLPQEVSARSIFLKGGFEAAGHATLDYGHMLAEITYSKITDGFCPSVIEGEDGVITIDKVSMPKDVQLYKRNGERRTVYRSDIKNNMVYEISAFLDMVDGRCTSDDSIRNTLNAISVVESVYRLTSISDYFDPAFVIYP